MANTLQDEVVVEVDQIVVFRNLVTGTNFLVIGFTDVDPNGVRTAPIGSILSGPLGTWQNTTGGSVWVLFITSAVFAMAPTEFYVDQTATPAAAAYRIFTTVALAVAAAETDPAFGFSTNNRPYMVRLREGQTHLWAAGVGIPFNSAREITLTCRAIDGAELVLSGVFPLSASAKLSLVNLKTSLSALTDLGFGRVLIVDRGSFDGLGNTLFFRTSIGLTVQDATWRDVIVDGSSLLNLVPSPFFATFNRSKLVWSASGAAPVFFSHTGVILAVGCSIAIDEDDFTFLSPFMTTPPLAPFTAALVQIVNTSIRANQLGAGLAQLWALPNGGGEFDGVDLIFASPGGGVVDFGAGAIGGDLVNGLRSHGVDPHHLPPDTWHNFALSGDVKQIGTLSITSVTPASLAAGVTGNVACVFTLDQAWPANGVFEVVFPSTFDVSGAGFFSAVGANGTFTVSVSGQSVFVTRNNDGVSTPGGTAVTITLSGITNPVLAGDTDKFFLYTLGSSVNNREIDAGKANKVDIT